MTEGAIRSDKQVGDGDRVAYFVPLRPFEQRLLQELADVLDQRHFDPFDRQRTPINAAFEKWHWSSLVRGCLNDDLGEESLHDEYQGDISKAYNNFLHFLAHQGEAEQSLFRSNQFRDANPGFLTQLANMPISCVDVRPTAEDLPYWETVSRIYHTFGRTLIFKDPLSNSKDNFEVWKLIRKFALRWLSPEDKNIIQRTLFTTVAFQKL